MSGVSVGEDLKRLSCTLEWHSTVEGLVCDAQRFASGPRYAGLQTILLMAIREVRSVGEALRQEHRFLSGWAQLASPQTLPTVPQPLTDTNA